MSSTAGTIENRPGSEPWSRLVHRSRVNLRSAFEWAWLDVVCQYRRSKIGPFWETINVAVMVAGLSLVTTGLFGGSIQDRVGYIGLGIIIWSAISAFVMEGCSVFVRNGGHIQSTNISIDLYVGRTVFKILIIFSHQLVLYIVGLVFGFVTLGWTSLLAIPGLLLVLINAYWIVTTLGFVCARYRDLEPIIRNLLQLAFLVTPIFWDAHLMSGHQRLFLVEYNPLYHFIAVVRQPLLNELPAAWSYVVVLSVTVIGYFLAFLGYRRMRRQVAYFV